DERGGERSAAQGGGVEEQAGVDAAGGGECASGVGADQAGPAAAALEPGEDSGERSVGQAYPGEAQPAGDRDREVRSPAQTAQRPGRPPEEGLRKFPGGAERGIIRNRLDL